MLRITPLLLVAALAGCVTSRARVPTAQKQYPLRVAITCENKAFSRTLVDTLNESGLVIQADNPGSADGSDEGVEISLSVTNLEVKKHWRRNTWCYITTIPGLPFAFLTSSILLAPIFGPYGGYLWFPPNAAPVVTIEVEVSADLSLGPIASTKITESASRLCNLRRCWVQCGRIDDKWFSTVLGGNWDKNYKTDKCEWTAFFDSEKYDWSKVEGIAFHNIACKAVTWLEEIFKQLEEGW